MTQPDFPMNYTELLELASKYKDAICYREDSEYWGLVCVGLCISTSGEIVSFLTSMGYDPDEYILPIANCIRDGQYLDPDGDPIYDPAKEVLQPRLDLLEQFLIYLDNA